jgi:type I restriction enzyme S subunit
MKTNKSQKNIPSGWQQVVLGDICKVNQGLQIPISERFSTPESNGKLYITTQFLNGKSEAEYICDYTDSVVCKKEDILMTRTGNSGIVVTGVEGVFHNNFFKVKPNKNVNSKLLIYNLVSPYIQYKLLKLAGASTIPDLNHGDFYSIDLLLPPISEQNRIVSVLETWDNTIEKISKKIEVKKQIKKGLMQDLLTGKKRLKGFSTNWKTFEIGDLLNYEQPTKYIVNSTNYSKKNLTPVLTANKGFVLGYTDEIEGIYKSVPVIIFDDFTMDNKFVDFPFKVKSSAIKILTPKSKSVNLKFIFEKIQLIDVTIGEHRRHYLSEYQYLTIDVPDIREQDAIEKILSIADIEIKTLENKLKILKEQKRYLLNNLITGTIRTPETLSAKLTK